MESIPEKPVRPVDWPRGPAFFLSDKLEDCYKQLEFYKRGYGHMKRSQIPPLKMAKIDYIKAMIEWHQNQ